MMLPQVGISGGMPAPRNTEDRFDQIAEAHT